MTERLKQVDTTGAIARVEKGMVFDDGIGDIKVMAVADNYAMLRRPGCYPFIKPIKELLKLPRVVKGSAGKTA